MVRPEARRIIVPRVVLTGRDIGQLEWTIPHVRLTDDAGGCGQRPEDLHRPEHRLEWTLQFLLHGPIALLLRLIPRWYHPVIDLEVDGTARRSAGFWSKEDRRMAAKIEEHLVLQHGFKIIRLPPHYVHYSSCPALSVVALVNSVSRSILSAGVISGQTLVSTICPTLRLVLYFYYYYNCILRRIYKFIICYIYCLLRTSSYTIEMFEVPRSVCRLSIAGSV